ncbi:MAG: hypothetical protein QXN66_06290 [Thermoplasmatales archaeon]
MIKIIAIYDIDDVSIALRSRGNVNASKWLMGGAKTVNPNSRHLYLKEDGSRILSFEFKNIKKGETLVTELNNGME